MWSGLRFGQQIDGRFHFRSNAMTLDRKVLITVLLARIFTFAAQCFDHRSWVGNLGVERRFSHLNGACAFLYNFEDVFGREKAFSKPEVATFL